MTSKISYHDWQVGVIADDSALLEAYPLFSAVNRCAKLVGRHQGRIIKLEYNGEGAVKTTLMLVGKVRCMCVITIVIVKPLTMILPFDWFRMRQMTCLILIS